ncbi:hypothetical protein L226DRAFT_556356 [Lentinus tigrinus ALCF2SS1-7]|uniref:N-acetyltransferase domain-containing protein n=1 Tax=Lentinus tigrinus ALCF2SS1-6 TaxID=1328759 RepID=A0A5C2SH45_9APHY|nr:hypothetical protein L227DRAFT_651276 [Lentinus tigrinus ALCF2SS1-6]RPD82602.1 hypothetical protein L226DRAFT_556356 [Lentinus tigrinus ALCF2SS1-7]
MVEPGARIRPVELGDQKLVRFLVGKAGMEPIATANSKMYTNPLVLAVWVGLSCVFVEYMQWWPKSEQGILGYLAPVPAFGTLSIALMFAIDWLNRWGFEDRTDHVLHRPDLHDISTYYSRSPSSGFWVIEYSGRVIGLIGLDASLDAESDSVVSEDTIKKDKNGKVVLSRGTSPIATIRHFYVDEQYRPAGLADDLLDHALKHAFTSNAELQAIRASDSPLQRYISDALRKRGFHLEKKTDRVGALRWQNSTSILEKERWAAG